MAQAIPFIMVGAAGRMGQTILHLASQSEEPFQLVSAVDGAHHPWIGKPLNGFLASAPPDLNLEADLPDSVPPGTVAIDFTIASATIERLDWVEKTGAAVVIGTSGFDEDQVARIHEVSKKAPVLLAANMSLGVNVFFELVAQATRLLPESFDIEITEMHHRFKKDAPSGTARRLAEIVVEGREATSAADVKHGRTGLVGARRSAEVGMHALRGGDVVGDHTVYFAALGERIELTHRASTRETFARGALHAARWLSGQEPGFYGMKDVLGL